MDIILFEGDDLEQLLAWCATTAETKPYRVRIAIDGDRIKFKRNEHMWTAGFGKREETA